MLEIKNISKSFGDKKVFSNFSLSLPDKGVVAIMGESGSGKTTLLRMIAGVEKIDEGQLCILPDTRFSVSFQEPRLFNTLTALDNVAIVSNREIASELLSVLELSADFNSRPSSLSGGMQRRVSLARAIAHEADIYLYDEPFAGLDERLSFVAAGLIKKAHPDKLSVIVTHDVNLAKEIADEIINIKN